jgi:hypothetical protein
MTLLGERHDIESELVMPGIEADSLLGFLALVGLLRALERARPAWHPRVSWNGPPWVASVHVAVSVSQAELASAALEGIETIAGEFDVGDRRDVVFGRGDFREYATRHQHHPTNSALAAALCGEAPMQRRSEALRPSPFVLMFGQGHQHFLDRLVAVSCSKGIARNRSKRTEPKFDGVEKIAQALFAPWMRCDETPAFRWDPEEDQRYALRYGNPSKAGAAPTVHGANRLAAVGFLSFPVAPSQPRQVCAGARQRSGDVEFLWPIWSGPISLHTLESLLVHPDVLSGKLERLQALGVVDVLCARRVRNDKYLNVARARPASRAMDSE